MNPIDSIRADLAARLSKHLRQFGFAWRKTESEFVRKKPNINNLFRVTVLPWSGWYGVEAAVFVGFPEIIRVFNEALGRKLLTSGPVLGFGISNRVKGRGSYKIEVTEDVLSVAQKLGQDFEEVALPFFGQVGNLAAINQFMNAPDESGYHKPESVSNACMGLIAAKLCKNPIFPQLVEDYFAFCREAQNATLAQPILEVRDYFRSGQMRDRSKMPPL
ncbi:MAG: hypothetical protein LBM92_02600 [Opitutaceae bacterium]|jgi:hypothetical protein|nr:hypothetical protein [Opitutaceae bacterium]